MGGIKADMTGKSEHLLAKIISYQGDERFSQALSDWLETIVPFDNITVLAYFSARQPKMLFAKANRKSVHANFENVYMAGAYLLDPFYDLHISRAPAGVYRLNDIAPDQFHRNRYFRDYYSNTSLTDELAFVSYPAKGTSVHVCLGRDASSNSRFSARQIAATQRVAPVVLALIERHWSELDASDGSQEDDIEARLIRALGSEHDVWLSPRQAEVGLMILRGHSSMSIALKLAISPETVKVFRKQLYRKCGISSQAELFNMILPLLGGNNSARSKQS
ncbi:helix-turn-helix transcriptional regulator [Tateyamaria sp. Alg231-49]|uniref:helix-turn-helix transcriptional regulator n=1 Tax=Tateyamaria sp. Alg231-49 TaxID=1922219 RepID=UPI001F42613B|nr:helix-turn-helix transcriptional regulator [Tateyamaria sp. Alg231-49]